MFHDDHLHPHFHAVYGEYNAEVNIESLRFRGRLPTRQRRLVRQWASARQAELRRAWALTERKELPGKIDPL